MGYFSFCSNLDLPAKEIYLSYKQRWDIEQCFDYLKNSVIPSASHAHTDDYFRGRFLPQMYYAIIICVYTSGRAVSIVAERDYYAFDLKNFYVSVK